MTITIRNIIASICIAILCSCSSGRGKATSSTDAAKETLLYAKGIEITHFNKYTRVDVRNPWDTSKTLNTYLLVDRTRPIPSDLPKGTVVKTPIQKAIVYTSVHSAIIEKLGSLDNIAGVCEPQYITSSAILERVASGKIADIGESTAPNIEKIIELEGEVIICSPFENGGYGSAEKLGIPIIEAADYMENHPLGRTEWIRFYGLLLGKPHLADSIFQETANRYNALKELVATHVAPQSYPSQQTGTDNPQSSTSSSGGTGKENQPSDSQSSTSAGSTRRENQPNTLTDGKPSDSQSSTPTGNTPREKLPRPTLLAERRYGSAWFIPGGASYIAIMYKDAGAEYLFKENKETGSVPLPFETVFEKGIHADIWLMKYTLDRPMTYSDLLSEYPTYQHFAPFRTHQVYTCNTLTTPYYDNITIHPDQILADLVHIFHPTLLPNHQLRYFFPMTY